MTRVSSLGSASARTCAPQADRVRQTERGSGEFSERGDDVIKFRVRYRSAKFAAFSNGENRVGTLVCESGGPSPTQLRFEQACLRQAGRRTPKRALGQDKLPPV